MIHKLWIFPDGWSSLSVIFSLNLNHEFIFVVVINPNAKYA